MKKTNTKQLISIPHTSLLLTNLPEISKQSKKQPSLQVNEHQKEMDKITNDMAVLFEKRITARELATWLAIINQHADNPEEVREFIWSIGFSLLPGFIECDTKIKKIEFLKEALTNCFSLIGKDMLVESVGLIGVKYATDFKTLRSDAESVQEFMKPYTTFLCICEMYNDYVFYKRKLEN